jgi:hypothetical protein
MENEETKAYIETLPAGIIRQVKSMQRAEGRYPSVGIRVWREMASKTEDGRNISSSGSYWDCIAFAGSRQEAGFLTAAIWKEYHLRCEVWYLLPAGDPNAVNPGAHIIDHEPDLQGLFGSQVFYGPVVWNEQITDDVLRTFAYDWTLDYYQIHQSNHRYVEVLKVEKYEHHHSIWLVDVKFSVNNDRVKLWIHPTTNGIAVFETDYSEEIRR